MMRVVFLVYCSSALLCDALKLLSQAENAPDIYVKAGCTLEVCEFLQVAEAPVSGMMCTDVATVTGVWDTDGDGLFWSADFIAALDFETDVDWDAPWVLDDGNDGTVMAAFAAVFDDGLDKEEEEALAVAYWNVAEVIYGVMYPTDQEYEAVEFFDFTDDATSPTICEFDMVDASVGFYLGAYFFGAGGEGDMAADEIDENLGYDGDNICVTGDLEIMTTQSDTLCDDKDTAGTCDLFDGELVATLMNYDLLQVTEVDILAMTDATDGTGATGLVATAAILATLPTADDCDPAGAGDVCTNLKIYKWADSVCSMGSNAFATDELCSGFVLDLNDNRERFVEFMTVAECWLVDIDPNEDDKTAAAGAGTAGMRSCFPSGPMSIYNDPKVTNLQGQKFEIMSTGTFSMLTVKESTRSLLDISATIDRAGSRCGATYIQNLTLNGEWIEQFGAPQIHMRATAAVPKPKSLQYSIDGDKTWHQPSELHWKNTLRKEKGHLDLSFGNVRIEVNIDSHRIVDAGVKTARFANFLNMNVKGANKLQSKYMLTGLLAHDDHRAVSALPSGCSSVKLLSTVTVTATSDVSRKPELKKNKKTKTKRTNGKVPKPDVMKRIHSNKRFKENKRLAGKLSEERKHKKKMSKSQKAAERKKITAMHVSNKKNHKKRKALGKKAHSMR